MNTREFSMNQSSTSSGLYAETSITAAIAVESQRSNRFSPKAGAEAVDAVVNPLLHEDRTPKCKRGLYSDPLGDGLRPLIEGDFAPLPISPPAAGVELGAGSRDDDELQSGC